MTRLVAGLLLVSSAALSARADYQSTVLSQGPAGYWRLNEIVQPPFNSIATNQGSMGTSVNGTYVGSPVHQLPGPFAGSVALGFDGVSQYVTTPWVAGLNNTTFSVELWANPAVVPNFAYVASSAEIGSPRSGWYIAQDNGGTFGAGSAYVVRMFNTNGANPCVQLSAPIITAGVWTHLVLTCDGTSASLYTNGVLAQTGVLTNYPAGAVKYVPNVDYQFTVGIRNPPNFPWPGKAAETAMYSTALSSTRVAAHYTAATTAPGTYAATVLADAPLLYDRYTESADVSSANIGTLGSAANAKYQFGTTPGVVGPRTIPYPGFAATNTGVAFNASGASVSVPALNFNTNTLTISGWVNASNLQSAGAGLVLCDAGTTYAGLTINAADGGLELGYVWDNDPNTFNWGTAINGGIPLPTLPDSDWAYVALVVSPGQASIFVASTNIPFNGATNFFNHINQAFDGATLFGSDAGMSAFSLNGAIDEVGIWNRSLGVGELYTQYASAVGGLQPQIFADPQAPSQPVVFGDTLNLTVDAGGTPNLTYFWRKNTTTIVLVTNVNVYSKPNFGAGDVGIYDVIVSNAFGFVTSGSAPITGQNATAPVIISGPVGRTIYPGGTLNLSVVATGGGLVYQWKRSNTNLPAATASSYTVSSVTTNDAGSYTVSVTNTLGSTNLGPAVVIVPVLVSNTYAAVIDADAPTAWWRLDDTVATTGSRLLDSMGQHDGVYTNSGGLTVGNPGAITGGIAGTAATFSGDGSYGYIPYFTSLSNPKFTLELWAKQSSAANNVAAASSADGLAAGYDMGTATYWAGHKGDGSAIGSAPGAAAAGSESYDPTIKPNLWVHLVIIFGNTGNPTFPYQIYINGNTDGFIWGNGATAINNSKPFIIGGRGTGIATILDHFFIGSVDEVAFYGKALTAAQIQAHFAVAQLGVPPSFTTQPKSQNAFPGDNITFSAVAAGSQPITLQWKKNGASLPGQTNNTLTVNNVYYTASSDIYNVAATNSAGGILSSNAMITVFYPATFANLTNGLVLHLKFDGDYTDSSGHNNNATPVAAPSLVAGKIGTGAFSNSTDTTAATFNYATLGTPSDLLFSSNVNFSIAYWVKLAPGETNGDLPFLGSAVGSAFSFGIILAPSYKLGGWQWTLNDNVNNLAAAGADNSINDGNWHSLVHTFNRSGNGVTFLDGVQVSSVPLSGLGSIDSGQVFNIGQDPTGTYPETGTATLDDMGIWRRALSDIEARSIYRAGQNAGNSFDTFGPIVLTINRLSNGDIELIWPTGTLKEATSLNGPWTAVSGASAPYYRFTPSPTNTFFEVRP